MPLNKTNFIIVAAPLPPDFVGDAQDFYEAMVERLSIQSPTGSATFVISDVEPASNVGPWLKGGTQWYVWSDDEARYVPSDVSASITPFFVSATDPEQPGDNDPLVWLKTSSTRAVQWLAWDGASWRGFGTPPSGTTAQRPTQPTDLETFWDTDCDALIHWERGAWRTVSGTPGDVKFVTTPTLVAAKAANPGWEYLGETSQAYRGRVLGLASKDPGATPFSSYLTDSGTTIRASGDMAGTETHVLSDTEIPQHTHLVGTATALHSDNNIFLYRVDDDKTFVIPPTPPPNHFQILGDGTSDGTKTGSAGNGPDGCTLVTSRQLSLANAGDYTAAAIAHNNLTPTLYLWALVKQ